MNPNYDTAGYLIDHSTGRRAVFFACNPAENKACTKGGCFQRGGPCMITTNPKYARTESKPMFVHINRGKRVHFELVPVDKVIE